MAHSPPDTAHSPGRGQLLADISLYALGHGGGSGRAYEAAHQVLVDSLACALRALRSPDGVRLIGPVVPGATMARGARVPGTSYELDPAQAAFNLGVMIGGTGTHDAGGHANVSCCLAAILTVADWQSRSALAEARRPPTVRDVLGRMIQAAELQDVLARESGAGALLPLRVAVTAVVTAMLGGARRHVVAAASNAFLDGPSLHAQPHARWLVGDAASRAVRLALLALAEGTGNSSTTGTSLDTAEVASAVPPQPQHFGCRAMERAHVPVEDAPALLLRFEAAVTAHYPANQAEKIKALFRDRARLGALPVNEMVSILVRN